MSGMFVRQHSKGWQTFICGVLRAPDDCNGIFKGLPHTAFPPCQQQVSLKTPQAFLVSGRQSLALSLGGP